MRAVGAVVTVCMFASLSELKDTEWKNQDFVIYNTQVFRAVKFFITLLIIYVTSELSILIEYMTVYHSQM